MQQFPSKIVGGSLYVWSVLQNVNCTLEVVLKQTLLLQSAQSMGFRCSELLSSMWKGGRVGITLFLNCAFNHFFWNYYLNRTMNVAARIGGHSMTGQDFCIGDLFECVGKFHAQSKCWDLHQLGMAAFTWHIWGVRNCQWKEGKFRLAEMLKDINIGMV